MCQEFCLARGMKLCNLSSKLQVIYNCQKLGCLGGNNLIKFYVVITPLTAMFFFFATFNFIKAFLKMFTETL